MISHKTGEILKQTNFSNKITWLTVHFKNSKYEIKTFLSENKKQKNGDIPCLALGAQISPPPLILDFFENKGG